MPQKRPNKDSSQHLFSCDSCYKRKVKCDKGSPCSYCSLKSYECKPSPIETSDRPRKKRFSESVLLTKIKKYEAALLGYGADLEAIQNSEISSSKDGSSSRPRKAGNYAAVDVRAQHSEQETTHNFQNDDEYDHVLTILDGSEDQPEPDDHDRAQKWYDRLFQHDTPSLLLFAVEPNEIAPHPSPFDIFKLWQIYCDNVHLINKFLHAPTFQRKMTDYGSHLHLAPAADQALFFSVYLAAVTSLSPRECEAIFFTSKQVLLEQYKMSTQVWLRRAGLWRMSELSALQALVMFLSSIQNFIDPRTLACFTAVADRIARRMGLHRNAVRRRGKLVEQEMKTRLWWELLLLDTKALERSGLGTSAMGSNFNVRLPSERSDADLEYLDSALPIPQAPSQPSSDMILFLIRAESAQFLADFGKQASMQAGWSALSLTSMDLTSKLHTIDEFEAKLKKKYLCYCDTAIPSQRLTTIIARSMMARMRISACVFVESCKDESQKVFSRLQILQQCTNNMEAYNQMRGDPSLERFKWLMMQILPIFAYINLLRLLQTHVLGDDVDRAWRAVENFVNQGIKLAANALTMRAWRARKAALSYDVQDPPFIKKILSQSYVEVLPNMSNQNGDTAGSSEAAASALTPPDLEMDFMALLAEMMSSESNRQFDWSTWLTEE